MNSSTRFTLTINTLWDGSPAEDNEWAEVTFAQTPTGMSIEVAARYYGDPAPIHAPGQTDGLWNYEVVELFVANEDGEYLEIEIGPHGNYLALYFSGIRNLVRRDIALFCQTTICGSQWKGMAHANQCFLPLNISRANAYAIHGQGTSRRFLAASPLPGNRPDFHQPHFFTLLQEISGTKQL